MAEIGDTSESFSDTETKETTNYPPLSHEWCLYCDDGNFYGGKAQNYFEQMVKLGSFNTVENFWRFFNATEETLRRLSPEKFNMRMFKSGIKPMWEDPNNRKGGKWLITCKLRLDAILNIWKEILVAAISGFPADSDLADLCGCVLVGRRERMEVQLWTRKKPPPENVDTTCEFIRRLTREPSIKNVQFISHQKAKKKRSKRLAAVAAVMSLVEEQKQTSASLPSSPAPSSVSPSPAPSSFPISAPPTISDGASRVDSAKPHRREGPLFRNHEAEHIPKSDSHSEFESRNTSSSSSSTNHSGGNHMNSTHHPSGSSSSSSSSSSSTSSSSSNNSTSKTSNGSRNLTKSPDFVPSETTIKPPLRVASPVRSTLNPLSKPFAPINSRTYIPSPEPTSPIDDEDDPNWDDGSLPSPKPSKPLILGQPSGHSLEGRSVWAKKKPVSPFPSQTKPASTLPASLPVPPTSTPSQPQLATIAKAAPITKFGGNKPITPFENTPLVDWDTTIKKATVEPKPDTKDQVVLKSKSLIDHTDKLDAREIKEKQPPVNSPKEAKEVKEIKEVSEVTLVDKDKEPESPLVTSETTEAQEEEEEGAQVDVTPSQSDAEEDEAASVSTPKKKKPKRRKHKSAQEQKDLLSSEPDSSELDTTASNSGVSGSSTLSKSKDKKKKEKVVRKGVTRKKLGLKKQEIPVEKETTCKRLTTTMKSHCIIL